MPEPDKRDESSAGPAVSKVLLPVLLPLIFLALAYFLLASRYRFSGFHGEKRTVLMQEELQLLVDQSKSLIDQGRYADALTPTLTLSGAYPENHIYLGHLAVIYDHLGRYDEEARYWEMFMDHAPTPIEACPQIGQAYWKQGEKFVAQALAAYQRCLALDPKNPDSLFYFGHALEMSGQWKQAVEQYKKGLAISPGYDDLSLGLARCWLRLDRPGDAKKLAERVLRRHPDSSDAFLVLGLFYMRADNYPEARKVLTRGSQLAEGDADFHVLLARTAEHMNDNAEALRQYTRVVELRPDDAQARLQRDALLAQNASK